MREAQLLEGRGLDREATGNQVVEQHSERVNVALNGGWRTLENLWCKIERRPLDLAVIWCIPELAGAEVHENDAAAIRRAHHVLRLDIAMDDVRFMHRGERAAYLFADVGRF